MSKLLKKIIAISLMATLTVSMLSACNSTSSTDGDSSTGDSNSTTGDVQEISFWEGGTEEPNKSLWEYAVDKYNSENPDSGYTIKVTATVNDQYKQKLIVAMSANECPDMYMHWSGGPMNEYVDSGLAQPITDLMTESGAQDRILDAAIAQATYEGEIYAVPVMDCSVAGIFYNTEIYDELGLKEPSTLTELEANCDALVDADYVPFALANASKWTGSMYYMYFAARKGGLDPFYTAADGSGTFESENFIYAGEKIQEWLDKGYFPEGVNGLDEDAGQSKQMMYTNDAAMQLHGSWMVGTYKTDSEEFYSKIGWFPFPSIEGGYNDASIVVGTIGGNFISFNCTGEKLEEAFKATTYYRTDEWEEMALDAGRLPPLKNTVSKEPIWGVISESINNASSVQLWYDQYLPTEVAEVHKSESQKLFDKSATPEEVAKAQQDAMQSYLAANK